MLPKMTIGSFESRYNLNDSAVRMISSRSIDGYFCNNLRFVAKSPARRRSRTQTSMAQHILNTISCKPRIANHAWNLLAWSIIIIIILPYIPSHRPKFDSSRGWTVAFRKDEAVHKTKDKWITVVQILVPRVLYPPPRLQLRLLFILRFFSLLFCCHRFVCYYVVIHFLF